MGAHARTGPNFYKALTLAEVLALPAVVDLDIANQAFGLGRSTGYRQAKAGTYPCPVIRLPAGGYRVASAEILRVIGVEPATLGAGAEDAAGQPLGESA
ncbi:helix-turn-helix transcriptional regulator [Streptacidiphilus neutrinimicus]|uniref:helix-turn-helix transcriptional regulator n=1 Tax=Streptacidiphilus neutrinimicus TaxID=105420 RepID=UPI0005A60E4D|nr:hypothetical protein [Streptacidiphilus neutrinimicus]